MVCPQLSLHWYPAQVLFLRYWLLINIMNGDFSIGFALPIDLVSFFSDSLKSTPYFPLLLFLFSFSTFFGFINCIFILPIYLIYYLYPYTEAMHMLSSLVNLAMKFSEDVYNQSFSPQFGETVSLKDFTEPTDLDQ